MTDTPLPEIVFLVERDEEAGGYNAACHAFGIFTQGDDLDDLRAMVSDAVALRFENEPVKPERIRLHFVSDEVLA